MSDTKKLNIDGAVVTPPDEALPTYKTIQETDTEYKPVPNSNMVKENGDNCRDGADEKMLAEEEKKLSPKADLADVKFVTGDVQNGDAKIDILDVKQTFTGLTKEELMKYSNDPFWVRMRWIMFIGFWLLWLGMLAGAIIIIVGAPKCAPPAPKTWWEKGPLLETDFGDLDSKDSDPDKMSSLLASLKAPGLILPEQVLSSEDAYSTLTNSDVVTSVKKLSKRAKENNVHLVVELTPNYVSKSNSWFKLSEQGEAPYRDYFVWADSNNLPTGEPQPPNNWVMVDGTKPAWSYSTVRKQYYLHQLDENKPDLNFRNSEVVNEFDKVIEFWTQNGADGIRLSKAIYLLVDQQLSNETISSNHKYSHTIHTEYGFYNHRKTSYINGIAEILAHWKAVILKHTDGQGLLMLKEELIKIEELKLNNTLVVDLPNCSKLFSLAQASQINATNVQKFLQSTFDRLGKDSWPSWRYSPEGKSLSSELSIVGMLLPGVPMLPLRSVLGHEDNSTRGTEEYYNLLTMRSLPSLMYGGYESFLLANDTIFAYNRLKSGNPGLMVLYNPSDTAAVADMTSIRSVPAEMTVNLLSKNYNETDIVVKSKVPSSSVPVSAKSVIVLTYVPLKDE